MPGRDVRGGAIVNRIQSLKQAFVDDCEFVALGGAELCQVLNVAMRQQVNLDRPAGRKWNVCGEVFAPNQDAFARLLEFEGFLKQVGTKFSNRIQQLSSTRCHERVCVDLAVWVVQRYADFLPTVLERRNLSHSRHALQVLGSIGPGIDYGADALHALPAQRTKVLARKHHNLAAAK